MKRRKVKLLPDGRAVYVDEGAYRPGAAELVEELPPGWVSSAELAQLRTCSTSAARAWGYKWKIRSKWFKLPKTGPFLAWARADVERVMEFCPAKIGKLPKGYIRLKDARAQLSVARATLYRDEREGRLAVRHVVLNGEKGPRSVGIVESSEWARYCAWRKRRSELYAEFNNLGGKTGKNEK